MKLGTLAIVSVTPFNNEHDLVYMEGLIPPGCPEPGKLILYVQRPHDFGKHKAIELTGAWKDYDDTN